MLGGHGPDLTHLASRRLIGAGLLPNTPAMRLDWIGHVQAYKPGARMPDMELAPAEQADLGAFLTSLQ
jgi:cytochrome c oxidase subunit 2